LTLPIKTATIFGFLMLQHELKAIPMETDLLLIKKGYVSFGKSNDSLERGKYTFQGPGISPDIGKWLRRFRDLLSIGFDFISLNSYQHREIGRVAHQSFLVEGVGQPILIIEDVNLEQLLTRPKNLFSIPLLYEKADGAPTTIVATI
jgi:arylformamidase